MTVKDMREALEAAEGFISDICPDDLRLSEIEERRTVLAKIDAALSAVPAPVSEEEIEVTDSNWKPKKISCRQLAEWIAEQAINERTGFIQRVAKAIGEDRKATRARLSRTEGEWRPDPKTVEAAAKCADAFFRRSGSVNGREAAQEIAVAIRSLTDQHQPDPEEPVRKMLDDQRVKSSGGVRTSTLKGI